MSLFQVVFYSRNRVNVGEGSYRDLVKDILQSCTGYNRNSGLTGALVFNESYFFQAMEGARATVCEQLWALAADARHNEMTLLSGRLIDRRSFEGWMVGYAGRSTELDALYTRYGVEATLDPSSMTTDAAVGLLRDFTLLNDSHFVQRARTGENLATRLKAKP